MGKVVGGERGNVMVNYADGVGTHDDLHYRGCRIRTCRRRIDTDELSIQEVPLDDMPLSEKSRKSASAGPAGALSGQRDMHSGTSQSPRSRNSSPNPRKKESKKRRTE